MFISIEAANIESTSDDSNEIVSQKSSDIRNHNRILHNLLTGSNVETTELWQYNIIKRRRLKTRLKRIRKIKPHYCTYFESLKL